MRDLTLGERVAFTRTVEKVHDGDRTDWRTVKDPAGQEVVLDPPAEGIVIGVRALQPGSTVSEVEYADSGYISATIATYRPDLGVTRTVYLVAFDMRRRPVMVFPEHMTRVARPAPTEAEVEASASAMFDVADEQMRFPTKLDRAPEPLADTYRRMARAALQAAKEVGR